MRRNCFSRWALCSAALLATTTAVAEFALPEEAYAVGSVLLIDPDSARGANDGTGYNFAYGWQWTDRWSPEISINGAALDTGNTGGSDFYQIGAGLDLRYDLTDWNWRPFAIGGLGVVYNDVVPDDQDSTEGYANIGAGVISPPGIYGIRLRAEARLFFDTFQNNQTDRRFGIGLVVPLGVKQTETVVEVREVERVVEVEKVVERVVEVPVPARAVDVDDDGLLDTHDNCPNSLPKAQVDSNGCMMTQILVLADVNFKFDSAQLTPDSLATLDAAARAFIDQPKMTAEIAGHTDNRGADEYNRMLSEARANSVRSYLMSVGIDRNRITARGYGESEPVDTNGTDEGRARNRRVEFRVNSGE